MSRYLSFGSYLIRDTGNLKSIGLSSANIRLVSFPGTMADVQDLAFSNQYIAKEAFNELKTQFLKNNPHIYLCFGNFIIRYPGEIKSLSHNATNIRLITITNGGKQDVQDFTFGNQYIAKEAFDELKEVYLLAAAQEESKARVAKVEPASVLLESSAEGVPNIPGGVQPGE